MHPGPAPQADLRSWLTHASYHVRLAVAIAALAPKLRLANVLALTWQEHLDPELRFITVRQHETSKILGGFLPRGPAPCRGHFWHAPAVDQHAQLDTV